LILWIVPRLESAKTAQRFAYFLVLCAALLLSVGVAGYAENTLTSSQNGLEKLEIITSRGTHEFSVEVMRSGPQRERGLMFRRYLPQDRGMLFDFGSERPVMMWMKNTYLPLDMIFIGRAGNVVGIAENAEPLSEKIIPSGAPAFGVLEVNAGTADRIGLKIGDSVSHPLFSK
jgi:uncharacterized membrane protein (UPF0127 family)